MITAELDVDQYVLTPIGRLKVLANRPVFKRGGVEYWRTVFTGITFDSDIVEAELSVVSPSTYPWLP
jgi:hypothetical protein